ncbi:cathepsin K-like [Heterodontus francisci]|uniref:cathepsin K-like n=1 Tax=Heterodontus francisci TaxID=7792 RepID=UPI00355BC4CB
MSLSRYFMMELFLLMACVLITICASSTTPSSNEDWETWKTIHGKKYNSKKIESLRKGIWQNNLKKIKDHNDKQGNSTYIMVMNSFGDLTAKEFAQLFNTHGRKEVLVNNQTREGAKARRTHRLPENVDWRAAGYVTPPKNQGQCSSCWAFSATGVLEGQMFKKTGKLIALSEQNLIDCSRKYGTFGCNGGWSSSAFDYIRENGGIEAESTYAYTAKDGKSCKYNTSESVASVSSYQILPYGDEEALTRAVAEIGPIAVVIDAGLESWQFYSSGIYYDATCRTNTFNHAVLVVGYGVQSGMKYYIIKNSWGQNWGQSGYILMARGRNNSCGIASFPIYALV